MHADKIYIIVNVIFTVLINIISKLLLIIFTVYKLCCALPYLTKNSMFCCKLMVIFLIDYISKDPHGSSPSINVL